MATLLVTLSPLAVSAQECQEQVMDGGFSACLGHPPTCYWSVGLDYQRGDDIAFQWRYDEDIDSHVFWYKRYGGSSCVSGAVFAWQDLDIEVSDYTALYLEADVKVIYNSPNSSGEDSYSNGGYGEFPCQLILDYEGTDGIAYRWNHGFLPNAELLPNGDPFGRTNYTQVTLGEWYPYESGNLIDIMSTLTLPGKPDETIDSPPAKRITRIMVGGNGCDFEAMIDNVSLCGIPETADGCLPMAKFKIDKAKLDFKDTGKCGGIERIVLEYTGSGPVDIDLFLKKDLLVTFTGVVYEALLEVEATPATGGKLHSEIRLEIDGDEVAKIHTSCSKPINVGDVHGDFEIVELDTLPPKHDEGDKVEVNGKLVPCDGVATSDPVTVTVGPLSETITMVEKGKKGEKWEYKRPKGVVGSIKEMKINWKKGTFEIKMDNADLTGITNPVTIGIQIGDCCGEETIEMKEEKHHWDYK